MPKSRPRPRPLDNESSGHREQWTALAPFFVACWKASFRALTHKTQEPKDSLHFPDSLLDPEVAHRARTVGELRELLLKLQRRQAQVATQAAHELMTPLTAQRCVAETVLRGGATAEQLEGAVVAMLEESRHMQQLIQSLLLVAQADGGMLGTPHTTIDASRVAADAVQCIEPLAEMRGHQLSLRLHGAQYIVAESALLRQVLLNLIHNTIVHTPRGTHIEVSVRSRSNGDVLISVVDDGPGMPAHEPAPQTRRFARRSEDRGERISLGLGLTIAKSLVRSQGGKTAIKSAPGEGTVVRISFRACPGPAAIDEPCKLMRRRGDRWG